MKKATLILTGIFAFAVSLCVQGQESAPSGARIERQGTMLAIETPPTYPGGQKAMVAFIQKNLKYPSACKEQNIEGKVYVQFTVKKDGSLSDIAVVRGAHTLLDAEAVRVVTAMPKWNPGVQRDKNINTRMTVPFAFKLD